MEQNVQFNMQTPAAILAPKQQYLNLVMNTIYKFGEICASPDVTKLRQERVSMLTRMLISYLPNPAERERLQKLRTEKLRETEKTKDLDSRREEAFNVDCLIVGEIITLMDDILSIVERQVISKTVNCGVSELEGQFYPAGYSVTEIEDIEGDED
ncbi:hypothetical protein MM_2766 [Methanosarcina mazei Go1]|uniref:Uncharacterized protein n=1 Tax=Methanosarcina mazei (strain ATCC BAA-159 / DSM 3647 / Goe1 / Go1 / JCM 11833 / OCM 88) TaxID=192952 RepID=Q8PTE9_METMA|nr:hypothetical protein [Methanosarcina mazei]AAM32462.1 hypothetical protein MM_2766 [Methanosarcina mazei Go1]WIM42698.1 hypothetical protein PSF70_14550 [Methanosarcina mazei]WIM46159.1 hypothetical protein PQQ20_14440 [Methanosarcina mazei]